MAPAIGLRQPAGYGVKVDANASPPDDFGRSLPSSTREIQTTHGSPGTPARRRSQVNNALWPFGNETMHAQATNFLLAQTVTLLSFCPSMESESTPDGRYSPPALLRTYA